MRQITTSTTITPATAEAPAGPYDLTTLADLKLELNITDDSNDVWLQKIITRGSKAIQRYCNMIFATETVQDITYLQQDNYPYQVPGMTAPLQLARSPVQSIVSCVVNQGLSLGPQTLVLGTDFELDMHKGELIRLNIYTTFPTNWDACPVTTQYVAGYADIPDDIEEAILMWCGSMVQNRTRDRYLKSQSQPNLGTKEWWVPGSPDGHFPPEISELLDKYRVPVVQ